jgi:hypothetical protein
LPNVEGKFKLIQAVQRFPIRAPIDDTVPPDFSVENLVVGTRAPHQLSDFELTGCAHDRSRLSISVIDSEIGPAITVVVHGPSASFSLAIAGRYLFSAMSASWRRTASEAPSARSSLELS